jgi:asparagine synthase (glutamine-hydrolysing)
MRLMSDVPLGVFLSGGIDSATIAALMSRMVKEPIQAFAVAFAEREANELEYARLVARTFGCDLHEILLHPDTFWANLPRLVWHEDEPIAHPSSVALNAVSQLAAERVKVVLTGEGSDETLGGYNKYRATMMNLRYGAQWERWSPGPIRDLVKGAIGAASGSSAFARKLGRTFLSHPATLDAIYFRNFAIFSAEQQERLLSSTVRGEVRGIDPFAAQHAALARRPKSGLLNALLYADTKTYLHELLMKQDQMSMAASIESRVPFLDHPLVEYATRLPEHMKVRGLETKVVLRRAMTGLLPEVILTRPKMGFPVPVGAWLRGPYRPLLDELVTGPRAAARGLFDAAAVKQLVAEHLAGRANHDQRLWLLLNLELWHRVFIDGEPIEATLGSAMRAAA